MAALVVALPALAVQLIGDGLYGALAVPGSLPHALAGEWPFALAARTGLDRIAAVRVALARGAIVRGEPARARWRCSRRWRRRRRSIDLRGRVGAAAERRAGGAARLRRGGRFHRRAGGDRRDRRARSGRGRSRSCATSSGGWRKRVAGPRSAPKWRGAKVRSRRWRRRAIRPRAIDYDALALRCVSRGRWRARRTKRSICSTTPWSALRDRRCGRRAHARTARVARSFPTASTRSSAWPSPTPCSATARRARTALARARALRGRTAPRSPIRRQPATRRRCARRCARCSE